MTAVPSPALARDRRMQVDYEKTPTRFQSTIDANGCYDEKSSPFRIPDQSQNEGINIFSVGWEDDEEDYVDMAPIKPMSATASRRNRAGSSSGSPRINTTDADVDLAYYDDNGFCESPDPEPKAISKHLQRLHPVSHSGRSSPDDTYLPSVVIQPASPHGSLRSFGSTPKRSPTRSSIEDSDTSDYSSDSDSSESSSSSDDSKVDSDNEIESTLRENGNFEKSDSNLEQNNNHSDIKSPSHDILQSVQNKHPNIERSNSASSDLFASKRSTTAGLAARKYLQMQASMKPTSRESSRSSSGLQRSSSRVGAVQSRIKKTRLPQSSLVSPTTNAPSADPAGRLSQLRQNRCMTDPKISESKRKSRTLDRDLSGACLMQTEIIPDDSDDDLPGAVKEDIFAEVGNRRSRDGASVMKMISERAKSTSLDSKYLEFLNGITRHQQAPQPSSAPCSPVVESRDRIKSMSSISNNEVRSPHSPDLKSSPHTKQHKKNKKAKKHKKKTRDDFDDEEEEEFKKYTEAVSRFTSARGSVVDTKSSSLSRVQNGTSERGLANFASAHFEQKAKEEKLLKKKNSSGGGLARKFNFGKSKTLGRTRAKSNQTFAESVESFNEKYMRQKSVPQDEAEERSKSDSMKKEKRRSFKIRRQGLSIKVRSKDRLNSDSSLYSDSGSQPQTPCEVANENEFKYYSGSQKSKGPPTIKQSLGFGVGDNRSLRSRTDSHPSRPGSPMVTNTKEIRSMTLDNRQNAAAKNARNNAASLKRGSSYGNLITENSASRTSLNSELSDSNSEMCGAQEEDLDDHRYKSVGMTGTLSRLLGRKLKERKMDDYDEREVSTRFQEFFNSGSLGRKNNKKGKYATMGSPRMRNSPSRELIMDVSSSKYISSHDFFNENEFSRGFRVNYSDDCDDVAVSPTEEFELALKKEAMSRAVPNKYATITGIRSTQDSPLMTRRNVLGAFSEDGDDQPGHRRQKSAGSADIVLNRSRSTKGKTLSTAGSRSLKLTGPSSHLLFSDALAEDEGVKCISSERPSPSPLRRRRAETVAPLVEEPSQKILAAAKLLYRRLLATQPDLLQTHTAYEEKDQFGPYRDDADQNISYPECAFGSELVTWLTSQFNSATQESSELATSTVPSTRWNVGGMLQALLEEGALSHVRREHHFQDTYLLYQFHESVTRNSGSTRSSRPASAASNISSSTINSDMNLSAGNDADSQNAVDQQSDDATVRSSRSSSLRSSSTTTSSDRFVPPLTDEIELKETLAYLQNVSPDAMFRMVLQKYPDDRSAEELMMIYEEILRIKALAHLSDSVKRELAGVLKFEFHREKGHTLFSQGDEGRSWYIIVKGSVNVDIQGQGVVCTLHEGDDFGNLAIINDAPRAATIVLSEENCQLLRVDKHDFVRILKDVEANTVRLKEHDRDVLILQKIHARSSSQHDQRGKTLPTGKSMRGPPIAAATPTRHNHKYAISAGTPAKIVEHVVKSLKPWNNARVSDEAMEDLILMYQAFMSTQELCKQLMKQYHSERAEQIDASKSVKRKVIYFVVRWSHIATHLFYDQPAVGPFLKELKQAATDDFQTYPNLKDDLDKIYVEETSLNDSPSHRGWITVESSTVQRYPFNESRATTHQPIKATDDVMLKVFNANRTYTTVRLPVLSTVTEIINAVSEKQGRSSDVLLLQVQSDGDMYVLPKNMTSAATSVGVNSRLFICSANEKDDIGPLDEQRVVPTNTSSVLELVSSQELAEQVTQYDWELINSIHVMEFVQKVFGSKKFHGVTSNIDVFARRFNQLAYWAPTEICACNNLNKRVQLLRKFIKISQHLKELQNMNAFMAVIIGLGNQAVSRLHNTWDKLPTKYKKMMTEFEAILDPSRNHRAYRLYVANLRPPLLPYLPLLMKDMTFQHEGNDSMRNGLVNFEKMHMMSNSIRGVIQACSKTLELSNSVITSKTYDESRLYSRNFSVVTDQKLLNIMSSKIEAKR